MSANGVRSAALYKALTLAERRKTLRQTDASRNHHAHDQEWARCRLRQWRAQAPFDRGSHFQQRLDADGLTEADLLDLLADSAEELRDRQPTQPSWLSTLSHALATGTAPAVEPLPPSAGSHPLTPFLEALRPIFQPAFDRLRREVAALADQFPHPPFDPDAIVPLLWAPLPERLLRQGAQALVLELHVARLQGRLQGDRAEERFQHFLAGFCQPDRLLAFWEE